MIKRVIIKNYKSIGQCDVKLGNLTVLVGKNGSGKSNFVDALKFIRDIGFGDILGAFSEGLSGRSPNDTFNQQAADRPLEITLNIDDGNTIGSYEIKIKKINTTELGKNFSVAFERFIYERRDVEENEDYSGKIEAVREGNNFDIKENSVNVGKGFIADFFTLFFKQPLYKTILRSRLSQMQFYNIYPLEDLRKPQQTLSPEYLDEKGFAFSSILSRPTQNSSERDEWKFRKALKEVSGDIEDYQVKEIDGYLFVRLQENGKTIPLRFVSDGTLRVLIMLTALYQRPLPPLVMIEEPENGIHIGALRALADAIKEAAKHTQVIITTHSPDLISMMDAGELRVVEKKDGSTIIAELDEAQRESLNDQLFSASDLIRIDGSLKAKIGE